MNRKIMITVGLLLSCGSVSAQTFFETAEGDGVLDFRSNTMSQLRVNATAASIVYGYYYISGTRAVRNRWLISGELRNKPNSDGLSVLIRNGEIQSGIKITGSVGRRWTSSMATRYLRVFDLSVRPVFYSAGYKMYDISRYPSETPFYNTVRNSFGSSLNANVALFPGKFNLYAGLQIGYLSTSNGDELPTSKVQTITPVPGDSLRSTIEVGDFTTGRLESVTAVPLQFNVIVDPFTSTPIFASGADSNTAMRPAFFGYFKHNLNDPSAGSTAGLGFCMVGVKDPSKTFVSLGYELPRFGDVTDAVRGKGMLFLALGVSIFK